MNILNSHEEIKKVDKGHILDTILMLPQQVDQAFREVSEIEIPQEYAGCSNIVVAGMGGSALGGRIVDSLTMDRLRTPLEVFTEVKLPNYVNDKSLVIVSSYSGNTAETISALKDAWEKKAKIFGICTGGGLEEFLKAKKIPHYVFNPVANPSGQPRMGLGYSISAILTVLSKLSFINFSDDEKMRIVRLMGEYVSDFGVEKDSSSNLAKGLALKIKGKIPVIIASEHLVGSAHAFKNQLNESAKTFSLLFDIPEMNHHLLEGLKNPAVAKETWLFIFLESDLYSEEVKRRYPITRDVVEKNDVQTAVYALSGEKKIDQLFEVLVLGSFASLYLAVLYGEDPATIPWVDYFKDKLSA
jgi:glucose/mannose-6-phosphate isomerase